jgi:uncharacterized delta-60 repeat protein
MLLKSWLHRLVRTVRNDNKASRRPGMVAARYEQRCESLEQRTLLTLAVSIDPTTIVETDGAAAAIGTVTRTGEDNTNSLTVRLTSSDASEVTVPMQVTIPAMSDSVTFLVAAVNDPIADGTISATITATEFSPSGDPLFDPTFFTAGTGFDDFATFPRTPETDMVLQPDGKVVAVGNAGSFIRIIRLNPDGSFDNTFGTGGVVRRNNQTLDNVRAVALDNQGRILVYNESGFDGEVTRFLTDGTVDTSFGVGGSFNFQSIPGITFADEGDIVVHPNGTITIVAYHIGNGNDVLIARLRSNGQLDTLFGGGAGYTIHQLGVFDVRDVVDVQLQPDGKVVAAITGAEGLTSAERFIIARFNQDGTLDSTFNGSGFHSVNFGAGVDAAPRAIELQSDGRIVAVGATDLAFDQDITVVRLNADGTLDQTFSGDGIFQIVNPSGDDIANDVVIQSDGRIVVSGGLVPVGGTSDQVLIRLNPDGTPDTSFDIAGTGIATFPNGISTEEIRFTSLQPDGKLVVLAGSNFNYVINRVTPPNAPIRSASVDIDITDDETDVQFGTPVPAPTATSDNRWVASADFNGDGTVDLATDTSVTFNDGTGLNYFGTQSITTDATGELRVGDVNGDTFIDIVAPTIDGSVNILLNDGAGNFSAPVTVTFTQTVVDTRTIALGDFDGDGSLDIAAGLSAGTGAITVLLNNGLGTFLPGTTYETGSISGANDIAVADVTGDGADDLILSKNTVEAETIVMRNNGGGGFTLFLRRNLSSAPTSITTGDFNGDGAIDIATVGFVGQIPTVSVQTNTGNGNFFAPQTFSSGAAGLTVRDIAVADFTLDGQHDVIIVRENATIELFPGDGTGRLLPSIRFNDPMFGVGSDLTVGDFNADNAPDVAVARGAGSSTVSVWLNELTFDFGVSFDNPSILESDRLETATLRITRPGDITAPLTIDLISSDPSLELPAQATFGAGQFSVNVPVTTTDDTFANGTRTVSVTVVSAGSGVSASRTFISVTDDETAGFVIVEADGDTATTEDGVTDTFTVALTGQPETDVVLDLSFLLHGENLVDGLIASSLTFTTTDWDTPQTVTVSAVDDPLIDGTTVNTLTVSVRAADSYDAFDNVPNQTVTVTNTDNDVAGFTITETNGDTQLDEGPHSDRIDIVLTARPVTPVTIGIVSQSPGEAVAVPPTVTFLPADWDMPHSVTLVGVQDNVHDGLRMVDFVFTIIDAVSDDDFDGVNDQTVTAEVADLPFVDPISPLNINEDATEQTINLTGIDAGATNRPLRVQAVSNSPSIIPNPVVTYVDGDSTGSFTFTPVAHGFGVHTISVTIEDGGFDDDLDTLDDNGNYVETLTVSIAPINDNPTVDAIADQVIDEDVPFSFTVTGIGPGPLETQDVRLSAVVSGADGVLQNPVINYTTGNSTATVNLLSFPDASGSVTVALTVEDAGLDGSFALSTDNGRTVLLFTVDVNAVNDQPKLDVILDRVVTEDDPEQTIPLTGIFTGGGETQDLRIVATSSNPAVIPTPSIVYMNGATTGSLLFTPAPDAFGNVTISVTVEDAGLDGDFDMADDNGTVTRTFLVRLQPQNDAPVVPDASFSINENSPVGAVVGTVVGTDVESNGLRFTITGGNTNDAFAINRTTGVITVSKQESLDRETTQVFDLEITVSDTGLPSASTTAMVQIQLVNVDEQVVVVNPGDWLSNDLTVRIDAGMLRIVDGDGIRDVVARVPAEMVSAIQINGRDETADRVTIDFATGDPVPAGGVTFSGGAGLGDEVRLRAGSIDVFSSISHAFSGPDSGTILIDNNMVVLSGVESVLDPLNAQTRSITLPSTDDVVALTPGGLRGDFLSEIIATGTAPFDVFRAPAGALTLDLGGGNDSLLIQDVEPALVDHLHLSGSGGEDEFNLAFGEIGLVNIDGGTERDTVLEIVGENVVIDDSGASSTDQGMTVRVAEWTGIDAVSIKGTLGDDHIDATGFSGDVTVYGDGGDDVILTGAGNDRVDGGSGQDTIDSGAGDDLIQGGNGNDTLTGGAGNDMISGDDGNDRVFESVAGATVLVETRLTSDLGDDVLMSIERPYLVGGDGNDSIDVSDYPARVRVDAGGGDDSITGTRFDDALVGQGGNDSIFGGFGNDVIRGDDGDDLVFGHDGDDSIKGGTGADTLNGGEGADLIRGDQDRDRIFGDNGDDIIAGGGGADTMTGGRGNDTFDGQGGTDRIDESIFSSLELTSRRLNGAPIGSDSFRRIEQVILRGSPGDEFVQAGAFTERLVFLGGGGNDTVFGGQGDDRLDGGSGNDVLIGNGGDDVLVGADGDDILDGGAGNDLLVAGAGTDSLRGGSGNDNLDGGSENDTLLGGAGNDILNGDSGNDLLLGEADDDQLTGGADSDRGTGGGNGQATSAGDITDGVETIDDMFAFNFDAIISAVLS